MARGLAGIIYGKEGMGKTSLGLQFTPGPVYCKSMGENGYEYLEDVGAVPANSVNSNVRSFEQLVKEVQACSSGTLLFDGLKGLQSLIFDYVTKKYYEDSVKSFNSYSSGLRKESPMVLTNFLDLCSQKVQQGVNTIFLGHMSTVTLPNTMGADYMSHVIAMDDGDKGGMRSTMTSWAGFIFFLNMSIEIEIKTASMKDGTATEGKANEADRRWIYTTTSAIHQAKNRWNMPPKISMGKTVKEAWTNLYKFIPETYKKGQEPQAS
jgi:AAA domain